MSHISSSVLDFLICVAAHSAPSWPIGRSLSCQQDKVAQYLMEKWGVNKVDTSLLCDDDNDLKIAKIVNSVFLPSISAVRCLLRNPELDLSWITN